MQERGTVSAGRTDRKNGQIPKSCEQVVVSGWVPSAFREPEWGRQAHSPPASEQTDEDEETQVTHGI